MVSGISSLSLMGGQSEDAAAAAAAAAAAVFPQPWARPDPPVIPSDTVRDSERRDVRQPVRHEVGQGK